MFGDTLFPTKVPAERSPECQRPPFHSLDLYQLDQWFSTWSRWSTGGPSRL